jgi:hypothetical protein
VQRIIDCHAPRLSTLPPEAVEVLDPELPARAVSDQGLLHMGNGFALLYFRKADYARAMHGLSREQIRAALATRQEAWSPEAASHAIPWLAEQLRGCLTLTALALGEARDPASVAALQQHFIHTLQRLATLAGSPALGLLLPSEVVEIALQGESRLVLEYGELPIADGQAQMERHHLRCAALARIMADLGDDAFLDGPPFVSRRRGVNVTWLDAEIREELSREGDTATDWRGGTVIPWPHEDLDRLAAPREDQEPVSVDVLYLDADEYESFASITTPAQQERDFAGRLAAARAPEGASIGDSVADHLHRLEVEQLVYLWDLRDLFAGLGHAAVAAEIEPLVRDEIPILLAALQRAPSWPPETEGDDAPQDGDVLGRLLVLEHSIQESADLFAHLTPRDWLELRPEWEEFLALGNHLPELTRLHRPT